MAPRPDESLDGAGERAAQENGAHWRPVFPDAVPTQFA